MALNVSAWAIRKPVPALVFFFILTALGIVHFRELPVTQMPNIDLPIVMVTVTQSGAASSELETQVTKKVAARRRDEVRLSVLRMRFAGVPEA